jgi:hypothetical protein
MELFGESAAVEAVSLLLERTPRLAPELAIERAWTAGVMIGHALADRAQPIERRPQGDERERELYISNLVDMFLAVITTPPSSETLTLLPRSRAPGRRDTSEVLSALEAR